MRRTIYYSPDGWNEDIVGVTRGRDDRWIVFLNESPDEMTPEETRLLISCLIAATNEAVHLNAKGK